MIGFGIGVAFGVLIGLSIFSILKVESDESDKGG